MVEQCRSCGVLLMEAFMWRHQPRTLNSARVAAGLLGELRLIRSSFSFHIEPGDWRLDPARGGGSLWDVSDVTESARRGSSRALSPSRSGLGRDSVQPASGLTLTASLGFPNGVLASNSSWWEPGG